MQSAEKSESCWAEVMQSGLRGDEVRQRMLTTAAVGDQSKRILAFYLFEMQERRLFEETGHRDTVHFAEAQLGMSRRRANELTRVGRELHALPIVDEAFRTDQLYWSAVLEIIRVAQSTTQQAWVQFAVGRSVGEVREEVINSRPGDLPGERSGYGLKPRMRRLEMRVTQRTERLIQQARELMSEEKGPIDDDALMRELAELALARFGERSPEAGSGADDEGDDVSLVLRNSEPIPAERREEALRRDRHCCRNCSSRYDVDVHHITARSEGGTHDLENLVSLCKACHAAMHEGRLLLALPEGGPPLFTSSDGTPINRILGRRHAPSDRGGGGESEASAEPPPAS